MIETRMDWTIGTRGNARLPALAGLVIFLAFSPGLTGPFVLDDHVNLAPVWAWLAGRQDPWTTVFDNASGPGGRPLAYLSFMANAFVGGDSPSGFKLFNLALHLVAAFLVWTVLNRWFAMLRSGGSTSRVAAAIALVWALHPVHVSTVLYTVQRMTLLASIAQLCAVFVYLLARERAERDPAQARRLLYLAIPAIVTAGVLFKETAVLGIALILVVELSLGWTGSRPPVIKRFMGLAIGIPLASLSIAIALDPDWIQRGYLIREFTLEERTVSIGRILTDYVTGILFPFPSLLALYRDGFPLSTGLLSPPTTLWTSLGLLLLVLAVLSVRRKQPLLAAGILWFLACHLLESTLLALEPQFEHRNYLASLGLILAATHFILPLLRRAPFVAAAGTVFSLLVLVTSATAVRAWNWGDIDRLLETEGPRQHVSRRLQIDRAIRALDRGDQAARVAALDVLAGGNAGDRAAAAVWTTVFSCATQGSARDAIVALLGNPPPQATHNHLSALSFLIRDTVRGSCEGLTRSKMLEVLGQWEAQALTRANPVAASKLATYRTTLSQPKADS
jgi:hypothetical protein